MRELTLLASIVKLLIHKFIALGDKIATEKRSIKTSNAQYFVDLFNVCLYASPRRLLYILGDSMRCYSWKRKLHRGCSSRNQPGDLRMESYYLILPIRRRSNSQVIQPSHHTIQLCGAVRPPIKNIFIKAK